MEAFKTSPVYLISALVLAYALYVIGLVIYRLYFHPLAKFPGPRFAAVSRWHEVYYDVIQQGQFTFVIDEWHRKYGPIIRIVPDELHIKDSEYYDTLYTKGGRVDKYDWMSNRFNNEFSALATVPAELHTVRRNAMNPLFSRSRIISLEGLVRSKVELLLTHLHKYRESGEPFPISSAFMALTGDVIMNYSFGMDYDHLNSKDFETTFHEPFMAACRQSYMSMQYPIIPHIFDNLPDSWITKMEPGFQLFINLRKDLLKQIRSLKQGKALSNADGKPVTTVFRTLIDDPNLPVSEKGDWRLMHEAQVVVGAGITTTGWSLSVAAFHILSNPSVHARLLSELTTVMPTPDSPLPHWTALEKLPYLTGCIREAIRLSYPVSTRNPRLHRKPLAYKDWTIPPHTPVSMTMNDVNNDETIFPDHEKFVPERWIDPPRLPDGSSLDRYFVCFQKGTRSCLGVNLAYCEMYLVMAAVWRRFNFELYETDATDVTLKHDFFLPSPKLDSKGVRVKCLPEKS